MYNQLVITIPVLIAIYVGSINLHYNFCIHFDSKILDIFINEEIYNKYKVYVIFVKYLKSN